MDWDDAGRLIAAQSSRYGTRIERSYDAAGRLERETQRIADAPLASLAVAYAYDVLNRPMSVTYPDGRTLTRSYGERGLMTGVQLGSSPRIAFAYDPARRLTATLLPNGLASTVGYAAGTHQPEQLGVGSASASALQLTLAYDANGRLATETNLLDPAQSQSFTYDDGDRLTAWRRGVPGEPALAEQAWDLSPVGDWRTVTRDGAIEQRTHTGVHAVASIHGQPLAHDAAGNLTRQADGRRYGWDAENRLQTADTLPTADHAAGQAAYLYDALGRRLAKRVAGMETRYVLDGDQVIQEIETPIRIPAVAVAQDDDGIRAALATTPSNALLDPWYDADGRRHDPIRINWQPTDVPRPAGYLADRGRVYGERTSGLSYGWTDAPAPIVRNFHPEPAYDTLTPLSGGHVWKVSLPNGTYPVAIIAGDPASLARANHLTVNGQSLTDPDPGHATLVPTYERGDYDGWLIPVEVTDGMLTIAGSATALDPALCLIEIGANGQPITQDMLDRLAQRVADATTRTGGAPALSPETRTFVWGPTYIDHLIAFERTTDTGSAIYYVHHGAQYSVRAISDANGNIVERRHYDPHGKMTIDPLTNGGRGSVNLSVGYTGRTLDAETGLWYFRARMFDAGLGRFVSRDPELYVDGYNLYAGYFAPGGMDPTGTILVIIGESTYASYFKSMTEIEKLRKELAEKEALYGPAESGQSDILKIKEKIALLMKDCDVSNDDMAEINKIIYLKTLLLKIERTDARFFNMINHLRNSTYTHTIIHGNLARGNTSSHGNTEAAGVAGADGRSGTRLAIHLTYKNVNEDSSTLVHELYHSWEVDKGIRNDSNSYRGEKSDKTSTGKVFMTVAERHAYRTENLYRGLIGLGNVVNPGKNNIGTGQYDIFPEPSGEFSLLNFSEGGEYWKKWLDE